MHRKNAIDNSAPGEMPGGWRAFENEASPTSPGRRDELVAANTQPRGEAALLSVIRQALDGDPFPVSGGSPTTAPDNMSLADRIRGILQHDEAFPNAPAETDNDILDGSGHMPDIGVSSAGEHEALETPAFPTDQPVEVSSFEILTPDFQLAEMLPEQQGLAVNTNEPPGHRSRLIGPVSVAFVILAAVVGVATPALVVDHSPRFSAEARLKATADMPPGWLDAAAKRLTSMHMLAQAVAKLKLDHDPEFAGETGAWAVAAELLSVGDGASDAPSRAQATLRDALSVNADGRAGVLRLAVTTGDGEKSARIANLLADAAVYDSTLAEGEGAAASQSRAGYDRATAALDAFTRENGQDRISAALDLEREQADVVSALAAVQKTEDAAKAKLAAAKSARFSDILDGTLTGNLSSPALDDLRQRYIAAKAILSQLSADLGPRHPRLIAQKVTVDGLVSSMQAELRRLVTAADAEADEAAADKRRLSERMAAIGRQPGGVDMARLTQLQNDVATMRAEYEASTAQAAKSVPAVLPLSVATPAVGIAVADDTALPLCIAGGLLGLCASLLVLAGRACLDVVRRGRPVVQHQPVAPVETTETSERIEPPELLDAEPPLPTLAHDACEDDRDLSEEQKFEPDFAPVRRDITALRLKLEAYSRKRAQLASSPG